MNKEQRIFREKAIAKLSSPEQLDQVMVVTRARAWLIVAGVGLLLVALLSWGIFGRITTTVRGTGLLIKSGGVIDIVSLGSGQLVAMYVGAGDTIQKGQIVARIAQPELQQSIVSTRTKIEELGRQHQRITALGQSGADLRTGFAAQQRRALQGAIRADRARAKWLRELIREQLSLVKKGLLTKGQLKATQQELSTTQTNIRNSFSQLRSMSVDNQAVAGQREKEILASQLRLSETERRLSTLQDRLEQTSRVVSTHSGRVLEVRASTGDVVGPGRPLLNLEPEDLRGTDLKALLFVPLDQGKSIRPGMRAQISPASVRQEEHGLVQAIITSVSDYPASEEGMERVLENRLLVEDLLGAVGMAPIAIEAELVPSPRTPSGYLWTSKRGPPTQLGPGTPCKATVSVRTQRPIERLLPLLREALEG